MKTRPRETGVPKARRTNHHLTAARVSFNRAKKSPKNNHWGFAAEKTCDASPLRAGFEKMCQIKKPEKAA
jgi:hypothetical protein